MPNLPRELPVVTADDDRLDRFDDGPRDECGVVGISGIDLASEQAFLAMYALQHRGQEAAGIVTFDDNGPHVLKGEGLVGDVFATWSVRKLTGRTAVGHVRYSTAGGNDLDNIQPITARYARGHIALAHNGNLTNHYDLRKRLVDEGAIFRSSADSETLIHLIAKSRHETIDAQVDDALTHLDGAFSIVISIDDTIYAARDPRGFRPLVLGKKGTGHIVCSETCALDILEAEYVRDLAPGEVIKIQDGVVTSLRSLPAAEHPAPCIFELVYFARPDSRIWGQSVDAARRVFGKRLAAEHPVEADAVIAVPDSANSAALGYAEESGIPFELGMLRHHYIGRTFIKPSQADRDFGARMKYNPVQHVLQGKRVIVVDDSLVRGTTSRSLVRMLRRAGATEVHLRIGSPPVKWPCFYGIDMPTRKELIASNMDVPEIAAQLGVDSLGYLSLKGMIDAVADGGPYCDACFSGNYPAPLVDVEKGFVSAEGPTAC
ncbi:MAG: amidophosphoribosyltransferase [Gemmatimonadetes bacterium]|mgnify:CR=1 FL=1|nr:amidophosphoribosyltransferase [Gemmatimonadota bacterium]